MKSYASLREDNDVSANRVTGTTAVGKISAAYQRYVNVVPTKECLADIVQRKATAQRTSRTAAPTNVTSKEPFVGLVQARGNLSGGDVHAVATHGIQSPAEPLPHLDAIRRSFGHHDVSAVRAHTDDVAQNACASLGAEGFTSSNDVAFAGPPSLHTAAHEAAHVVQQRGAIQLKGGLGQPGDRYEQHADRVADLVVRGESAEAVLDEVSPGTSTVSAAVQLKGGRGRRWRRQRDAQQGDNELIVAQEAEAKKDKKPSPVVPDFAKHPMDLAARRIRAVVRQWQAVRGRPDATRMDAISRALDVVWQQLRDNIRKANRAWGSEEGEWIRKHGAVVPPFNNDSRWLGYLLRQLGGDTLQYLRELDAFGSFRSISGAIIKELDLPPLHIGHHYKLFTLTAARTFYGAGVGVGAITGAWELRYSNSLGMKWTQKLNLTIIIGGAGTTGNSSSSSISPNTPFGDSIGVTDYFSPADFDEAELHHLSATVGVGGVGVGREIITFKHHNATVKFDNSGRRTSVSSGRKPEGSASATAGRGDATLLGEVKDAKGLGKVKPMPVPEEQKPPKKQAPKRTWKDVISASLHFPTPKNHRAVTALDVEDLATLQLLVDMMAARAEHNWDDRIRIVVVGQSSRRYRKPRRGETKKNSNLIIARKRAMAVKRGLTIAMAAGVRQKRLPQAYLSSMMRTVTRQQLDGRVDVGTTNNDPAMRSSLIYVQYFTTRSYLYEDENK